MSGINFRISLTLSLLSLCVLGCHRHGYPGRYGYGYNTYPPNYGMPAYGTPQVLPQGMPVPGGVVVPQSDAIPYEPGSSTTTPGDGWDNSGTFDSGTGYEDNSDGTGVPRPKDEMFDEFGSLDQPTKVHASAFRNQDSKMYWHDPDFRRVNGILQFEQKNNSWNVLYSMRPEPSDDYNGKLTLITDARLRQFRNGDIVRIRGHVDPTVRDALGKPKYRIETIETLVTTD